MDKIIIPLNGKTAEEVEQTGVSVISAFTWDSLIPTIEEFVKLRPYEIVDGLIVDKNGISVQISRKRIRKTKKL